MEDLLHTFLKKEPWIEICSEVSDLSWENQMRYEGKWISYGSSSYTKEKAKELEPEIGRFIKHIKYSYKPVVLTSKSPKDSCALVVYCNNLARRDARRILESHDIKVDEWITNIYSLRNLLNEPTFVLSISCLNPERLVEIGEIVGVDMKSKVESIRVFLSALSDDLKEHIKK